MKQKYLKDLVLVILLFLTRNALDATMEYSSSYTQFQHKEMANILYFGWMKMEKLQIASCI
jgi:hypothetical protein